MTYKDISFHVHQKLLDLVLLNLVLRFVSDAWGFLVDIPFCLSNASCPQEPRE